MAKKMHLLQAADGAESMFILFGRQHQIDLHTGPRTCDSLRLHLMESTTSRPLGPQFCKFEYAVTPCEKENHQPVRLAGG
jgi:hypothetical protein